MHMHVSAGIVQENTARLCVPYEQGFGGCRVEMTVSRGVLRIVGTIIGGTIGFLIMLHHSLAANPYALMARSRLSLTAHAAHSFAWQMTEYFLASKELTWCAARQCDQGINQMRLLSFAQAYTF